MIQLCPHCKQQWCEATKNGAISRALGGFVDSASDSAELGGAIGGLFGKTGKNVGEFLATTTTFYNPITWIRTGTEAVFGDAYKFHCPNCGGEWSTDDELDDQTEKYEKWVAAIELIDNTSSLANSSKKEKLEHIKALNYKLDDFEEDDVGIRSALYDALAYSYLVLQNDATNARKSIEKSLSLSPEDPISNAICGMTFTPSNKPLDNYKGMQHLINYKDVDEEKSFTHFTLSQFEEHFEDLSHSYVEHFLDIPPRSRRFLVIDDDYRHLPDSFFVLPIDRIPSEIAFPVGHPRSQELYVVHPYKSKEYIPYNDFQLSLLRDEVYEFSWIMECLGAKSIAYHEKYENEQNAERQNNAKTGGGAQYGGYSGNGAYERGGSSAEYRKFTNELKEGKHCNLTPDILPYIPQDVVWYQHRPQWHRNCESRKLGRLNKASFSVSTSEKTATSEQERKKIEADLKILLFKANGNHEQDEKVSLRSEENHTWEINVEFYPISEYNNGRNNTSQQPQVYQGAVANAQKKTPNYLIYGMLAIIIALIGIVLALIL